MSTSLVSCIVPVYNGARYLAEALQSILAQTHAPIEIVVVDDGSTDGSAKVARKQSEAVRVIRQPNRGQAAALNTGIEAARGEFFAFLDSDDLWHPEKLALQMARFRENPDLEYCVTHLRNFLSPERELEEKAAADPELLRPRPAFLLQALLARRVLVEQIGALEVERRHTFDTEWFLRMKARGAVGAVLPEILVLRRLHGGNKSVQHSAHSRDEYLELMRSVLAKRREGENR